MESLPLDSYSQFLGELKSRIQAAQRRASLAVNRELVILNSRRACSSLVNSTHSNGPSLR